MRRDFPWRQPRHELVLLALIAVASLSVIYPAGAQDVSRMCLTDSVVHGRLSADQCLQGSVDHAAYGGHLYSDKAPGISILAVPAAKLAGLRAPARWHYPTDLRLWAVRVATGGVALLMLAFLLGRVCEGLVAGSGGASLVAVALGTELSALAGANFAHVPAAALSFAAFVLAWSRRPFSAGVVAGAAVLVEYQAGLATGLLAVYVAFMGVRPLGRYLLGAVPAAVALGAYDNAAFGSPFHLSYRYVAHHFAAKQAAGFFGIHAPSWHAAQLVLGGDRGLLFDSPLVLAAAAGLALSWRRSRREVLLCAGVVLAFLALDLGYFDPYGGNSPGPRFFAPALPFLALGLPAAFRRFRSATAVLVALSVTASTAVALTWTAAVSAPHGYRGTVWRQIEGLFVHGTSSTLVRWTQRSVLSSIGASPLDTLALTAAVALAALALSFAQLRRSATEGC
jgi:hypothetical protein